MSINRVIVSGNLTKDAELRRTAGGMSVLSIGIAVNDRARDANGNWQDRANYFDCAMFGTRAEGISPYLKRGTKVAIEGKLRWSSWEQDGNKRSKVEIIVDEIEFMSGSETRKAKSDPYDELDGIFDEEIPF